MINKEITKEQMAELLRKGATHKDFVMRDGKIFEFVDNFTKLDIVLNDWCSDYDYILEPLATENPDLDKALSALFQKLKEIPND